MNNGNLFKRELFCSVISCCLLFPLNAAGQEADSIGSEMQVKKHHTFKSRLLQVRDYLDTMAAKKFEPEYVEVPKKPWRVILRGNANSVDLNYENKIYEEGTNKHSEWEMLFRAPVGTSIGVWVGYRGLGLGFSQSLTKNSGQFFSISSTAAKYGFNVRLRRYQISKVRLSYTDYVGEEVEEEGKGDYETYSPVWIRSLYLNGYYVFNGRRYSQAAAYNQSDIQRRSAGSFLAGVTYYHSSLNFDDIMNAGIMMLSHNVGRMKSQQINLGIGYGYNLVPCRGLVINAMVMPNIGVFNRVSTYEYDFNYCLPDGEKVADNYGAWNKETRTWANGKTHKPIDMEGPEDAAWQKDIDMWFVEKEAKYAWFRFNVDLRVGMAYNWKNYFVGLQAQFNNFSYRKEDCKVRITDWFARASLGIRL